MVAAKDQRFGVLFCQFTGFHFRQNIGKIRRLCTFRLQALPDRGLINPGRLGCDGQPRCLQKLQPGLQAGQFRFLDKDGLYNWKNLPLKENSWWGGEPAADLLTGDLRPGNLTLYSREDRLTLMRHYKLVPDPGGYLTLLHPFWPAWADSKEKIVSPLLVYAELLLTGDARCIETALKIYEQALTPILV